MKQAASVQAGHRVDLLTGVVFTVLPADVSSPSGPFPAHFCACLSSLEGATINLGSRSWLRLLHPIISFVSGRRRPFSPYPAASIILCILCMFPKCGM